MSLNAYHALLEADPNRIEWSPDAKRQYQASQGMPTGAQPQKPQQQIKITCDKMTFVVTYVDKHGWCVYTQQPGASKAQLNGKPFPTLKDAFISVATML